MTKTTSKCAVKINTRVAILKHLKIIFVLAKGALHQFSTYVHIIGPHSKIALILYIFFFPQRRAVGWSEAIVL